MALYLVRHDQTALSGVCYGQTDIESKNPYVITAQQLKTKLPSRPAIIATSPLRRCADLASALYPAANITRDNRLKEVNFGHWENKAWDNISRADLDRWALSPTGFQFPGGEHLADFEQRVQQAFDTYSEADGDSVLFTHAGVIRLMIALYTQQTWQACLSIPVAFASVTLLENGSIGQL